MIDFTSGVPGGAIYWTVIVWIASGFSGIVFAILLFRKYRIDLKISQLFSENRKAVSRRAIESTIISIAVNLGIIGIGIYAAEQEYNNPNLPDAPSDIATIVLLAIPWLWTYDKYREFRLQMRLLNTAEPSQDASRLFIEGDKV